MCVWRTKGTMIKWGRKPVRAQKKWLLAACNLGSLVEGRPRSLEQKESKGETHYSPGLFMWAASEPLPFPMSKIENEC